MTITFYSAKRDWTLRERGLDFVDADAVFAGVTIDVEDTRQSYGEMRMVTVGTLRGCMVVLAWTPRCADRDVSA